MSWIFYGPPDDTQPRRFAPLAPIRSINPALRAYASWSEDADAGSQPVRRFGLGFTAVIPTYYGFGQRNRIFTSLVAAGAFDEAQPEQHRAYWQVSVPNVVTGDVGKSAALVVTFGGSSAGGGGVFGGQGSDAGLAITGVSAGGVLAITGKTDWTPILEIDLAIDAGGRLLLIDVTGRVLMVSAGNTGWTGQTSAKSV